MVDTTEELILMDESPVEWLDYDQIGQSLASVKAACLAHCEQAIIDAQLCIDNWRKEIQSAEEYLNTPQPDPEHWLSYKRKLKAECNLKTLPESIELKLKSTEALQLKMTKIQPIVRSSMFVFPYLVITLNCLRAGCREQNSRSKPVRHERRSRADLSEELVHERQDRTRDHIWRGSYSHLNYIALALTHYPQSSHHLRDLQKVLADNNITVALALGYVHSDMSDDDEGVNLWQSSEAQGASDQRIH